MQESLLDYKVPWRVVMNQENRIIRIMNHTMQLMYEGNAVEWDDMLPVFQVSGVLQWMGFYILSSLY